MRAVLISLCFVAFAAPALAQETAAPAVLDQVFACSDINDEAQRLACYDGAVGRLREAQTSGSLVAVDRTQVQEIEREAFGFSLPSLPQIFRNRGESTEGTVAEMQLTVERVVPRGDGTATFYMSNGQVWTQLDGMNARHVRAGREVTIRRATLGSFMMSVPSGGPALRVRRTQ
jgi:hypothetical protein